VKSVVKRPARRFPLPKLATADCADDTDENPGRWPESASSAKSAVTTLRQPGSCGLPHRHFQPPVGLSGIETHASMISMPTAVSTKARKVATRRVRKKVSAHGIKAVAGNPFAGLEHIFGSIALPRDPRPPREITRARILADHHT
jgi:hypothetical protein